MRLGGKPPPPHFLLGKISILQSIVPLNFGAALSNCWGVYMCLAKCEWEQFPTTAQSHSDLPPLQNGTISLAPTEVMQLRFPMNPELMENAGVRLISQPAC